MRPRDGPVWTPVSVVLGLSILLVVLIVAPLWQPLLLAAVLSSVTSGWHRALTVRTGRRPKLAAAIMTAGVVILLLAPIAVVVSALVREGLDAARYIQDALEKGGLEGLARRLPDDIERPLRRIAEALHLSAETITREAAVGGWTLARLARDLVESASKAVFGLAMMLIAYFALLLDGRRLVTWIQSVSPLPGGKTGELFEEFRRVSRSVLGSTLLSAAAQGGASFVGYLIAGVPNAVFFAAVTAFAALIPFVGTPIVTLPVAALLLITGNIWQGIFFAIYAVVVISVVDNIVKPMVVRGGMQMSSAVVFFSLIGGILSFGAIGIVVGPLAVTFFLSMLRLSQAEPSV